MLHKMNLFLQCNTQSLSSFEGASELAILDNLNEQPVILISKTYPGFPKNHTSTLGLHIRITCVIYSDKAKAMHMSLYSCLFF